MKKILYLIFILVFITGCNAEYNIEIKDNSVNEKLNISNVSSSKFDNIYIPVNYEDNDYTVYESKLDGIEYYNINNNNNVTIDYKFKYNNFQKSTLFNTCYENAVFTIDSYELLVSTSNEFLCYNDYEELDKVKVIIKSNYKYLDSNADEIDGDKYIWYINKENKNNKQILLRLDTTESSNKRTLFSSNVMFIFFFLIIILVLIVILFFKIISIQRNKV